MTSTVSLHADAWADYFGGIRRQCGQVLASVALRPDGAGSARATVERTLRAIRYEPERGVLELSVGGAAGRGPSLRYFISVPRRIAVQESQQATVIVIDDASGQRTSIALRHVAVAPDPSLVVRRIDWAAGMATTVATTHFVDRATWRLTCPRHRPVARRTCRTYVRGARRGAI